MATINRQLPLPRAIWTPPLLLTVRFSTSLPDLHLDIPSPAQTSVVALKHLIRSRLKEPDSQRRLRFIHQGKILPDSAALNTVLRPLPPLPPSPRSENDPKGKGKAIEGAPEPPARIYVNCSIGDSLTDEELKAEAKAALDKPSAGGSTQGLGRENNVNTRDRPPPPTRGPRGFDRLLNAGFTTAEVNQLRLQFQSVQSMRHTPDSMPSPDTLRSMEDGWIDNNADGVGITGAGADGAGEFGDDSLTFAGMLDVLIPGMLVGFFFPLGSTCWLLREEGLFSKGWKAFVIIGFCFSLAIGIVRAIAGDKI
jgi:hypothetical protein